MPYPAARRSDVLDDFHGTRVPDPYRWLEDDGSAETAAWVAAQDRLARGLLDGLAGRDEFRSRLRRLDVGFVGLPVVRGERTFYLRREADQDLGVLRVQEDDGTERALVDPNALSADHTVTLDWWQPSWDGARLAYKLSQRGDEEATLYVVDVASGAVIDTPIDRTAWGSFAWVPDGSAYYYVRRLPPEDVPPGEDRYHRRVWRRRVGSNLDSDELVFGEGRDKTDFYFVWLPRDGRWLTIAANKGNARVNDLYLTDLMAGQAPKVVVEGETAEAFGGVAEDDGRLYLHSNLGAPNWRFVVAEPDDPGPARWTDVLAEGDGVLKSAFLTKDAIVAVYAKDVISHLAVYDRSTCRLRTEVALPGLGTIAGLSTTPDLETRGEFWFGYTDFTTPHRVYHYQVTSEALDLYATAPGEHHLPAVEAKQVFFSSKDGTQVPMFVLHRQGLSLDGERPTVLYGYGGWAIAQEPGYQTAALAWVEQGGVYAVANIRGGSEYGEAWHRAGMREHKQSVFDDFIAAAEWLAANGYTSPEHLGIQGGSNGGILVGACVTQRPELFASAVCGAPLLDMVRFDQAPNGQIAYGELGNPHVASEFEYLYAYSPYHRVPDGTAYPAVLFSVFDADARVPPWHARKTCAALQFATASDRPVLYRREEQVGHAARSLSRAIELSVDILSFQAANLGLDLSPLPPEQAP